MIFIAHKIFYQQNISRLWYCNSYGTTQMQLHTSVHVLVCLHACVNMLPVTCDGVRKSHLLYTSVTRGAAHMHVLLECIQICYSLVHVLLTCTCNTFIKLMLIHFTKHLYIVNNNLHGFCRFWMSRKSFTY